MSTEIMGPHYSNKDIGWLAKSFVVMILGASILYILPYYISVHVLEVGISEYQYLKRYANKYEVVNVTVKRYMNDEKITLDEFQIIQAIIKNEEKQNLIKE